MKKVLFFLLTLIGFANMSEASHVVGGNFVINQTGPNQYTITVRVYRDCCASCASMPTSVSVGVYDKVTNAQIQTFTISSPVVSTITLGDECYTPTGICLQEGIFTMTNVVINNNTNGYYLQTQLYARNSIIDNITSPGSTGMSFYAEIPDPALASMNDSPDFGAYPSDGYFCVNNTKLMDFSVTDPDGDSLVYSLVDPLNSVGTGNITQPGPYSAVSWLPPYNLANIVGGAPPMSVNPQTGVVSATAGALGTYVFALRIEEYRNGVKIGEVRRDMQYHALNCIVDDLPSIQLPDSVAILVGTTGCFDIVVIDADAQDTISILVSSPTTFADGATVGMPPVPYATVPDTTYMFYYIDEITGLLDSTVLAQPVDTGGAYYGIGGIGLQYCWETSCQDIIGNPYQLQVSAFSLGCSGDTNFIDQTVQLYVVQNPLPQQDIFLPDTVSVIAAGGACFDVVVLSNNPTDTVNIWVSSSSFGEGATLSQPTTPVSTNPNMYEYYFYNDVTWQPDTVILQQPNVQAGGVYWQVGGVGLRYCWTTGCEDIQESAFNIKVTAFKIGCFGDTTKFDQTAKFMVYPPEGEPSVVPNVFSPNGDGMNDIFKLDGVINYCYDSLHVQIFNRWGILMYESDDPNFGWDGKFKGKDVSEGVYYVVINGVYGDADVTSRYQVHLFRNK